MKYIVRLLDIEQVTHDVKLFRFEKPSGYQFVPGQATDVAINKPGYEEQLRPFTFTALNDEPYLEFTIKRYPDHQGVTDKLHQLKPGDELIIHDVWGAIQYNGPGYFMAGGAGITPFMAILRELHRNKQLAGNTLFFSNKTASDIIYEQELREMLGEKAIFLLTRDHKTGYLSGHIDLPFIQKNISDYHTRFYVCGPDAMITELIGYLEKSGAHTDALVFEK